MTAAKKGTAAKKPAGTRKRVTGKPSSIETTVRAMTPASPTTIEQRRAAVLATIDEAILLMRDPECSSSARAVCIKEIRTMIDQLGKMDATEGAPASAWASGVILEAE